MSRTDGQSIPPTPLGKYVANQKDQTLIIADPTAASYFQFINEDGAWYVQKLEGEDIRFSAGTVNADTNWTNRASLVYTTFDQTTFA